MKHEPRALLEVPKSRNGDEEEPGQNRRQPDVNSSEVHLQSEESVEVLNDGKDQRLENEASPRRRVGPLLKSNK